MSGAWTRHWGFQPPLPDFSLVLHHLTRKNPSRRDSDLPIGQRLLEKVATAAPSPALERFWADGLASDESDWWMVPSVKLFKDAGVDVLSPRAFNPSTSDPSQAQHALPPVPEPYDTLCAESMEQGHPPYWSPFLACWLNPKPHWALELIALDFDPWSPAPDTILPGWTLAGALGLDPSRPFPIPVDALGDEWKMAPWSAVKAAVLEHRLSERLLIPSLESIPSPPRHRF